MMGMVEVGAFGSKFEAELVKAILFEEEGISAVVTSDDCGGLHPSMHLVAGVQLLVRPEDEAVARELLSDIEPGV